MKHILISAVLSLICTIVFFATQAPASLDGMIPDDEIFVFTQKRCPHCHTAEAYLKEAYPDLQVQIKEISRRENMKLFFACGKKFNLDRSQMGTPLFCMGDNYVMGWSPAEQMKFDAYVQKFLPKE